MDWPHGPLHRITERGIYFITASTYLKEHYYRNASALDELQNLLFATAKEHAIDLYSWALLSNHYHLVVESQQTLLPFIRKLHSVAARERNRGDCVAGRRVWFQYRDTQLTHESSYLARLKYVNENAVHHGIVLRATNYRWCSATWFEDHAERAFVRTVQALKIDRINLPDDFNPILE
jgi:putative transposase